MPFNGITNTFDTISELKTQIGNANTRVTVLGYYSAGDGGGGQFYWDSTSTESDNAGTIIQVSGVATGRWKRAIEGNTLNVLWFGAKNDYTSSSTTNNTPAITATISAATTLRTAGIDSQTQGSIVCVYFPYGKGFRITDTINVPNNISIIMDGQVVFDNTANDRPAIIIGDSTLTQRKKHIIDVTNKNQTNWPSEDGNGGFTTNSIGVKIRNHYWCDITIRRASNFAIGVQCFGDPQGFVYNEVHLGILSNNKVNLDLSGANNGWCNENNFYGGRFASFSAAVNNGKNRYGIRITSSDGTYTNNNNNIFYKPCFELNGTIANPGEALPILIVHGTQNAFYSCRSEQNYVASDALIRTLNDSAQNLVEVGFSLDGTIEDLGNYPSTIVRRRGKLLTEWNHLNTFDSGDIVRKICPYNSTFSYAADELSFVNSADSTISSTVDLITIGTDYIQIPSTRGVSVRIDTTANKSFVVKKATISGFGGRTSIRCFNSAGTLLYNSTTPYVKGYPFAVPSANTAFGGVYRQGSDTPSTMYFTVHNDVAYMDVIMAGGTVNPLRLRQFQVQALDAHAAVISPKKKQGLYGTQSPASGTWQTGDIIYNATPASNNIVMWQCTSSGTPGTWISVYNSNKTVTSVNGSTGDVTVAPSSGGTGYIQNTATLQASSSFFISGNGITNGNFQVRKDGVNTISGSLLLYNTAATRGANFQLNGDTNPGLATWVHNGTTWIKRVENFATGLTAFYPASGDAIRMVHNSAYIAAYDTANTTRTGYLQFNSAGTSVLGVDVNQGLAFATNGGVRQTITADGNVGIGTTSPAFKLDVNGDMRTTVGLTSPQVLSNSSVGTLSLIGGAIGAASTRGGQIDLIGGSAAAPNAGDIVFYAGTGGFGSVQPERMRIDALGNVGIGISSPSDKLSVAGNVFVNGFNGIGFFLNGPSSIVRDNGIDLKISTNRVGVNTSTAARSTLDIIGGVFAENNEGLRIINDGGFVSFYNSANSTRTGYLQMATIGGAIFAVEQNQGMSLRTNSQERIYIEPDGDVGIGIHTPATKLDVNGQITIRGGSPGTGKVLMSDAGGLATWQTPTSPNKNVRNINDTSFTVNTSDDIIIMSSTITANRTITLPTASANTGKMYHLVTLEMNGSFQYATSPALLYNSNTLMTAIANNSSVTIYSDGTNWRVLHANSH
jgi:hypothetical protein